MMTRVGMVCVAVVLLVSLPEPATAQSAFDAGLKAGFNVGNVEGSDASGFGSREGIVAGGFLRLGLREHWSIQTEMLYSQKGAEGSDQYQGMNVTATVKSDYIEIPVMVKYTISTRSRTSPFLMAGPALALSIASTTNISVSESGAKLSVNVDNFNERTVDVGVAVGAGVDIPVGRSMMTLDARYTGGLVNMWKDVNLATLPADFDEIAFADEVDGRAFEMKHFLLSFTVGFLIPRL